MAIDTSKQQSTPSMTRPLDIQLSKVPWWAIILILAALLIMIMIYSSANYYETFKFLLAGVVTTLRITFIAFPISVVIGLITEYYTAGKPIQKLAECSRSGAATNLIYGLSIGMESTVVPVIILAAVILVSFSVGAVFLVYHWRQFLCLRRWVLQ